MAIGTAIGLGILGTVGALGSAALGSSAASRAASEQSAASERAAELQFRAQQEALAFQREIWETQQQNISPWLSAGGGALANLRYLMGIPTAAAPATQQATQATGFPLGPQGGTPNPFPGQLPDEAWSGLPPEVQNRIIDKIFGPGGPPGDNASVPAWADRPDESQLVNLSQLADGTFGQPPIDPLGKRARGGLLTGGTETMRVGRRLESPIAYRAGPDGGNPPAIPFPLGDPTIHPTGVPMPGGGRRAPAPGGGLPVVPVPPGSDDPVETMRLDPLGRFGGGMPVVQVPGGGTPGGGPPAGTVPGADIPAGVNTGLGEFGSLMDPFGEEFAAPTVTDDPGYQWRLQQGTEALERSAAARGGLLTGGTARAIADYSQGLASQEYENAYNRALTEYQQAYNIFQQNQSNQFNRLAAMSGMGQTATGQLTSAGTSAAGNFGNILLGSSANIGNALQQSAAARASGYVGSANALSGGLQGVTGNLQQILMAQQMGLFG